MKKSLSVIIPVLNEELNIKPLTNKIIKILKRYKFEIIFVDDSSADNSKKILSPLIISGSIIELILISDSPLLSTPVTILLGLIISITPIF